ncbi:GDCCVxC domain-containing (seleno)protein [Kangsaoukella pontilimi]|uniref:GDCCVxC domain-containing (seleno)protein n=1 Tax=Kangsaoukella pontilimi TaxID=2691042 RepID=UPI001D09D6D7|nr:GDCCVxC domain-containing (seleno)protein [Kangsaoukella pontilimi]
MAGVALISTLTCPACGHVAEVVMPEDRCLFFWDCPSCHEVIRPKAGDCCVFCSYGTVACPPVQATGRCGG